MPGHGAGLNTSGKAVAHHKVSALAPFGDKLGHLREVIAVVAVSHDDEVALRGFDARTKGVSVSLGGNMDDARAVLLGDVDGAVGRAVVGYDDLATNAGGGKRRASLIDADRDGFRFVETRNDHGDFEGLGGDGSGIFSS